MTQLDGRIVDLERESAELRRRLQESLDRQEATAEILRVINSSPDNLALVFDAILEKAIRLCEAGLGYFLEYDGERFRASVFRGASAEFIEYMATPLTPGQTGGALSALVRGDRSVHVADMKASDAYRSGNPARRALVDLGGGRAGLWVALRNRAALLGALVLYRPEARPFSDNEIALTTSFADQAVIAMENARLITETREALDQQTATAEVLQVINSSPGDLAPVFDALLESAMRLCGAAFGVMSISDGATFRNAATRGVPSAYAEFRIRHPPAHGAGTGPARMLAGERVVHTLDLMDEDAYRNGEPNRRALVDLGGARTSLRVALVKDEAVRGAINIYRQEVRPFSDKQIALLRNFAAQAVIAMENARLITETREALDQQTATAEVLQVINSSPGDLAPVFDAMLDKATNLCEAAYGVLWTYDGQRMTPSAVNGDAEIAAALRAIGPVPPAEGSLGDRLLHGERVVHITDAEDDQSYRTGSPARRTLVEIGKARTLLGVALRKDDRVLGLFSVYRREIRPFTDKQIALLQNFAAQAVIAMENARLLGELRTRTDDLTQSLEYQTATSEVLKVISRSTFDLQLVLDTLCETAARLCDADSGHLALPDGDDYRPAAAFSMSPEMEAVIRQISYGPGRGTAVGRALLERRVVQIDDIGADPEHIGRQAATLGLIRTILAVPLLREGEPIGAFGLSRSRVEPFTERQIDLVRTFADQAVIAIENTRLITETREALEQQTATAEVLQVINSSPGDLAPVFDAMLERAMRLCEASFGQLAVYEEGRFRTAATQGMPAAFVEYRRRNPPHYGPGTQPARILAGEPLIHVPDLKAEEAYLAGEPNRRALVDLGGVRTSLMVPLRRDNAVLGFINFYRREVRPFSDKQIALLQNFAAQAVIAMENARLLGELRERTDEIAGWNRELEARVAAQLAELERTGKLRRFLAPQLADLIVAQGDESILESHRREIVVVFCDLRGFTPFAERAEPEEVMALLRDYHAALGPIVASFEGTLDHYAGDGIMVFFNDPLPTPEPAKRAIDMAVAMRAAAQALLQSWRRHGHDIGFGVGISQGYATLGQIGFAERMDYTAIGTVTNLAARLCAEAKDGQILISRRVATAIEDSATLEEIGDLPLKGLNQAVAVYNVAR